MKKKRYINCVIIRACNKSVCLFLATIIDANFADKKVSGLFFFLYFLFAMVFVETKFL